MEIANIAAVVTGGASGLGAATARALAAQGAKVALFDLNADKGEALAAELGGAFCKVDICNDAEVDAAFAKARAAHGQERVLINCAGTGKAVKSVRRDRKTGEIVVLAAEDFDREIQINLVGTYRCIVKAAAGMLTLDPLENGERGAIVNTASIAAEDGQTGQVPYSASKAGIVGMTLPLARDLSGEAIRVNTILPGIFDTPLMQGAPDAVKEALYGSIPFPKRFGAAEEFARLAVELVGNGYINGEDIRLDGGIRMGLR
ncbi:SDR family oxidoreductase [Novosphingobium resinovorum]|uniref:3-hydroxy-2-methylbutyryl-CoA dehydrogenase n=1 Tax=Novosphingobium resinovorum TaxID=158500 RepID=A0A1D8AEH8_9SPHN|nr:SDR family oxidoreductase [Novosphingobium resinovorum]AOR80524.1 3-hydroxy-2-methylbutyryl-CoA dehydrogenase [Novosphingobium resinovorum]